MTDADTAYLAQHIHDAIAEGPTAELGVEVRLSDTEVSLAGTVGTEEQREQLADIAGSMAGRRAVRNDVVVVHGTPDVEPEAL
jgi:osmotically-inducible protein OsmY